MASSYAGQVVWITGGGTGIGRALALEAARQGADVAVSGRRAEPLDEVAAAVRALGRRALAVAGDVVDEEACRATVARIVAELGRLDVAVANAGYGASGAFERLAMADWRRQFDVNVFGLLHTVYAALPELQKTGGRLALVSSVLGLVTLPGQGPYAASKFAVRAIGLTLAQELHGSGVSVTTIYPGFVESDIARTDNQGRFDAARKDPRPAKLMWPADRAARVMLRAISRRQREMVFTGHGKAGAFFGKHFPGLVHFVMTRSGARQKALAGTRQARLPR
jgi:NAD(P)-dependent dehydrogenase (short-subunit alcohol dehydrogenase family)